MSENPEPASNPLLGGCGETTVIKVPKPKDPKMKTTDLQRDPGGKKKRSMPSERDRKVSYRRPPACNFSGSKVVLGVYDIGKLMLGHG